MFKNGQKVAVNDAYCGVKVGKVGVVTGEYYQQGRQGYYVRFTPKGRPRPIFHAFLDPVYEESCTLR